MRSHLCNDGVLFHCIIVVTFIIEHICVAKDELVAVRVLANSFLIPLVSNPQFFIRVSQFHNAEGERIMNCSFELIRFDSV